jgi:RND superfamily putative drug exporter
LILGSGAADQSKDIYLLLDWDLAPYEQLRLVDEVRSRLPKQRQVDIRMTGKQVVQAEVNEASKRDLSRAELIGLPVAALFLRVAFRGWAAAWIPILCGLASVISAMGITTLIGHHLDLSNFVLNVIPMVGLALSIDFALIIVSRFREELAIHPAGQALQVTMRTAGKAVLWSAACVLCGLAAVMVIPLPMFSTIAAASITVLLTSLLAAFTLAPAWLSLMLRRLRIPTDEASHARRSLWQDWASLVMKRPYVTGVIAVALLYFCLLPLDRLRLEVPDETSLPKQAESRIAYERWEEMTGLRHRSLVYVVAGGLGRELSLQGLQEAYHLEQRLRDDPEVEQVRSIFSVAGLAPEELHRLLQERGQEDRERSRKVLQRYVSGGRLLYEVTLRGKPDDPAVHEWLRRWEQAGEHAQLPYRIGGEAKYAQEVHDTIFRYIPGVIAWILLVNYALLFVAFRSVLIPLKTILMNLLCLGASYGIITWICQDGRFGLEPGSIAIMIPVFVFGLVFGISMDYGVFLISRIHEAYRETGDNALAVRIGMASSGRVITLAAVMMIAVTLPFAMADVAGVRQLGIGIASALFIDATMIRMGLVPVLMKLFGRWNWWAPRLL